MADDLDIIDKVELCLKGLDGIATIAAHLQSKFGNDLEVAPAARGLSILSSDTTDRLDDVAEELHNTRHEARMQPDPLVELGERNRRLSEEFETIDEGAEPERNRLIEQELIATTRALFFTPARTLAGGAAQLRRVLHEIEGDFGERADGGHAQALRSALAVIEARQ